MQLPNMNIWALLPYVVAVPAIFIAGAVWDGDGREDRAYRAAHVVVKDHLLISAADKASLYEEIRNARSVNAASATRFERIVSASDQERATFKADMQALALREAASRDEAHQAMTRLDNARGEIEKAWRDGRIPAGITCGVLQSPGCPDLPGRAAGAAGDRGGGVPGGAAGAGGGNAAVPATPDTGSGDTRGGQ